MLDLVAEKVESLCGHRPELDAIAEFVLSVLEPESVTSGEKGQAETETLKSTVTENHVLAKPPKSKTSFELYTGKRPISYTLLQSEHPVRTYKDVLIGVCKVLAEGNRADFDRVLGLHGKKRPYFTRSPHKLRQAQEIGDTGIYVETNLSANNIIDLCRNAIAAVGQRIDSFSVQTDRALV